jgi:hypothetical protein
MFSMSQSTHAVAISLTMAVLGWAAISHAAEPVIVTSNASVPAFDVKANNVNKDVLAAMCVDAAKKSIYPSKLFASRVDVKVVDEVAFTCFISGKQEDSEKNQRLYQSTGVLHGTDDVQYAVEGNIKTRQMDVARTDLGKAREAASIVLAGMFMKIQTVSVESKKAVYSVQVQSGTKCTVTMVQEAQGEIVRWRAGDIQCGEEKTKNRTGKLPMSRQ